MRPRLTGGGWRRLLSSKRALVVATFAAGAALRLWFMLAYRPAFLGISDAGTYIDAAHRGLFQNVYDPAGYPLFIRLAHAVYPHLSLLILLQHCIGIATAALFYLAVRRVTGSQLLGLVPAALILFDGYGVWVEHTPISETVFTFLLASSLYVALLALDGPRWLLALDGLLAATSGTVRPVGFILVALIALWLFWNHSAALRPRLLAVAALIAPACAVAGSYVLVQHAQTGFTGITRDSGRILYARVAGFADCAKFKPPAGTRALCERTPAAKRGSFNQYLTGFPDRARQASEADRSISPAWRVFGPPPRGNSQLAAFGRTAILHQPLDYVAAVADDFHYYWADHHRAFIAAAARVDPAVDQTVSAYYRTGVGTASAGLGALRWYGRTVEVTGILMIVLLVAPLAGLLAGDRERRRAAILFAATGWLVPLVSDAVASVDPRFILPSYGPLASASALGLSALAQRGGLRRLRRQSATPRPA